MALLERPRLEKMVGAYCRAVSRDRRMQSCRDTDVVDGVRARPLLRTHQAHRQEGAAAVAGDRKHLLPDGLDARPAVDAGELLFQLTAHLEQLALDVRVVGRETPELGEDGGTALPAVGAGEPAGRLVQAEHADEEEDGWQNLHCQGHLPLSVAGDVEFAAVVDPWIGD